MVRPLPREPPRGRVQRHPAWLMCFSETEAFVFVWVLPRIDFFHGDVASLDVSNFWPPRHLQNSINMKVIVANASLLYVLQFFSLLCLDWNQFFFLLCVWFFSLKKKMCRHCGVTWLEIGWGGIWKYTLSTKHFNCRMSAESRKQSIEQRNRGFTYGTCFQSLTKLTFSDLVQFLFQI